MGLISLYTKTGVIKYNNRRCNHMQLIIKPTGLCNFNCSFCSAANLDIAHPGNKVPQQIKEVIERIKPDGLIITGGEPLCVDPEYYLELADIAKCNISFTTNLKGLYLDPEKWRPIFTNPTFDFITSFNYGDSRRWDKDTPYTEEQFIKVSELYKSIRGESIGFIAVIDDNNEDRIIDHVLLAKRLGTRVKINNATALGLQGTTYPRYKLFQAYLKIIDMGLEEYEIHCKERKVGRCPFNINFHCRSAIRCCYVDSKGELHYSTCDDEISLYNEYPLESEPPKPEAIYPPVNDHITDQCIYCDLFRLCNGCNNQRTQAKKCPEYCEEMLKLKDRLIETEWLL